MKFNYLNKFMNQNEWEDNMNELEKLALDQGVEFDKHIHPALVADSKTTTVASIKNNPEALYEYMVKEFGHCVLGKWQFIFGDENKKISCIRSGASFGDFEICCIKGNLFDDIERFATAKGCLERIKELLTN